MATISSEGPAFFYDARPSSHFAVLGYTGMFNTQPPSLSSQTISHSPEVREGLADVISMHRLQIPLFHFEAVATPWLQLCKTNTGAVRVAD